MTKIYESKSESISFPSIEEVYSKSIIQWDDYYDMVIMLSVKTSNSFKDIESMEFHKFNSLISSLNKYIEQENKNNGENGGGNQMDDAKDQMKNQMSDAKNMMSSMKMPKMK